MANKPPPPAGIVPHLVDNDGPAAIEHYKRSFGAVEIMRMSAEDGKRIMHAQLTVGPSTIYLCDDFPEHCVGKSTTAKSLGGTPITFHQRVPNCDAAKQKGRGRGRNGHDAPPRTCFGRTDTYR